MADRYAGQGGQGEGPHGGGGGGGGSKIFNRRNIFLAIALIIGGSLFYAHVQSGRVATLTGDLEKIQADSRTAIDELESSQETVKKLKGQLQEAKDALVESKSGAGNAELQKRDLERCKDEKASLETQAGECKVELAKRGEVTEPKEETKEEGSENSEQLSLVKDALKVTTDKYSACLEKERTTLIEVESLRKQLGNGDALKEVKKVAKEAEENEKELESIVKNLEGIKKADEPVAALEEVEKEVEKVEKEAQVLATDAETAITLVQAEGIQAEDKAKSIESAVAAPLDTLKNEEEKREKALTDEEKEEQKSKADSVQFDIALKLKNDMAEKEKRKGLSFEDKQKLDIDKEKAEVEVELAEVRKERQDLKDESEFQKKDSQIVKEQEGNPVATSVGDDKEENSETAKPTELSAKDWLKGKWGSKSGNDSEAKPVEKSEENLSKEEESELAEEKAEVKKEQTELAKEREEAEEKKEEAEEKKEEAEALEEEKEEIVKDVDAPKDAAGSFAKKFNFGLKKDRE